MNDSIHQDNLPDSPYPGIDPFSYAGRNVFFARKTETRSLIRLIVMYRGVLLYSDSGAGKSSLINAGLIPLAIEEGYQPERISVQPKKRQEITVKRLSQDVDGQPPFLPSIFAPDETQERVVLSVEDFLEAQRQNDGTTHPLLIFDQFEEWITLFEEGSATQSAEELRASQERIRDAIISLINDSMLPVKVLIALREDYLAKLTPFFEQCPSLPDQYLRLTSLKSDQIYQVIRGPFEKYPGRYQPEVHPSLAKKIQGEFETRSKGTDIRLTELQIVCQSLFETGKEGTELDQFFAKARGVQGILERYLKRALESLEDDQQEPAVALLSRMVTSAGTRKVISQEDLLSQVALEDKISRDLLKRTLDSLEHKTKLVRRERHREVYYYEIASEFLVAWIRKKAQERQERRKLEEAERRARAAAEARIAWIFRGLTAGLAVALVIAGWAAFKAFQQRNAAQMAEEKAVAQRDIALSRQLAVQSTNELNAKNYDLALLLAIEAGRKADTVEAFAVLRQALAPRGGRTLMVLSGHEGSVLQAAWNADGSRILTASADGTARVWDVETGTELVALSGHTDRVRQAIWNADESRILTASDDGTARVWDVSTALNTGAETGTELVTLSGHTDRVRQAIWNADESRILTASADHTARVWDAETGAELVTLSGHEGSVFQAVWNADENRILTASADGTARVWHARTGDALLILSGHEGSVVQAVWNADESGILTAGDDGTVRMWSAKTGAELLTLSGHEGSVVQAVWNADESHILTASTDGTARMWDTETGAELLTLSGHEGSVVQAVWNADESRILTTSADGTARVWDAETGELATLSGHTGSVRQAEWNADESRILTASADGTARVWDAETGAKLLILFGHTALWNAAESRILTASADGTARVWDAKTGAVLHTLSGHKDRVRQAAWNAAESRILTASDDGTARVWDARTEDKLLTLSDHTDRVSQAIWNPDESRILTASDDGTARMWDARTGDELLTFSGHTDRVLQAAWNVDESRILTVGDDGTARVWDAETGDALLTLAGHMALWNADGDRILTASDDGTARVWDVSTALNTGAETGTELVTLSGHTDYVLQAQWNADESRILTASRDDTARVWDAETGAELATLSGHTDYVLQARWNADESRILTASADGTARVWDAETGAELVTLSGHTASVWQAIWNDDESRILTASDDGTVRQYYARMEDLSEAACQRAPRNMKEGEWRRFMGEEPYGLTCRNLLIHPSFIEAGRDLARAGDVESALAQFQRVLELDPGLDLNPEAEVAQGLVERGEELARAGDVEGAVAQFRRALELDPGLDFHPETEAGRLAAQGLVEGGKALARAGDVEGALDQFQRALELDPGLDLDPETEAGRLAAPGLVAKGEEFVTQGKIEEAIAAYAEAQMLDPTLEISASSWNVLCWFGSLWGYAAEVMDACERAVELAPDNGGFRDSRGVARALTGDYPGAIKDFKFYVEWSKENDRYDPDGLRREAWIAELEAGGHPFDEDTLAELGMRPIVSPPVVSGGGVRSERIGVHGRDDYWQGKFEESDYQLIREARIEHVKLIISDQAAVNPQVLQNVVGVFKRLREINPDMDFVVRLDDPRNVNEGVHPTPQEFADRFIPIMNKLREECPYVVKFEILSEPNYIGGLGGWGPEADQARDFSDWFLETYELLKADRDWALLGFPGLAIGHGPEPGYDLDWIEICRPAVAKADWLGVHCYWQNPTYTEGNHLSDSWGLRFKAYHEKFPDKVIEITEFANANGPAGYPVDRDKIAEEYVEYYQELFKYPYINSAASFIMSSPNPFWEEQGFTWRKETGEFLPVVPLVGSMPRPALVPAEVPLVPAKTDDVEIKVFDQDYNERDFAWAQAKYGVAFRRAEVAPGQKVYRLVELREKTGDHSLITQVLDEDGNPMANVDVAFHWSGAPETEVYPHDWYRNFVDGPTNVNGDVGPGMGPGAYHGEGEGGPHAVWVRDPNIPSDICEKLGMLAGTFHDHFDQKFQLVTVGGEPAPVVTPARSPTPTATPEPTTSTPEPSPLPTATPSVVPIVQPTFVGEHKMRKVGLDGNIPVVNGVPAWRVHPPDFMASTGAAYVRINFLLDRYDSPRNPEWQSKFDTIVDGLHAKGIQIYGHIDHEVVPDSPGYNFLNPGENAAANAWLDQYVENFATIVEHFGDRVKIFESFDEPNNWPQGRTTAWIHPYWFAKMLEGIYRAVKLERGLTDVTLVSGPLLAHDIGGAENELTMATGYLRDTYQAGKEKHGWEDVRSSFGSYPLDGIGYHLYVCEGLKSTPADIQRTHKKYLDAISEIVRQQDVAEKKIYVSGFGWSSASGEDFQARSLKAGFESLRKDPRVALAIYFCTQDFPGKEYGLIRPDKSKKPAYNAFLEQARLDREAVNTVRIDINEE
jgi:WD40 repeat protein